MTRLDRLDWNLVPLLNALLRERNVSRAARRIGVSQSAASGALARLRRFFDDDLLVRNGHGYDLTPVAEQLLPLAAAAVVSTRSLVEATEAFDPATTSREFVLLANDYSTVTIGTAVSRALAVEAPAAQLQLVSPAAAAAEAEERRPGSGETTTIPADVAGWIVPQDQFRSFPSSGTFTDTWVCVVADDHPEIGDHLTYDDLVEAPWVAFSIPGLHRLPKLRPLLAHGIDPRIEVVTDTFAAIPFLVPGTRRLALVQSRLGRRFADVAGIRVLEPPVALPPLQLTMVWHPDLTSDHGHRWFRELVARCCDEVGRSTP